MNIIKRLYNKIEYIIANRSYKSKITYLRKIGCKVGDYTRIISDLGFVGSEPYLVEIGDNCLISNHVAFSTHDGGCETLNNLYYKDNPMDKIGKIIIGDNVFIGCYSVILPGVTIGNNVIIGAGSVVTKSFPNNVVIAGVPAKIITTIEEYNRKLIDKGVLMPTGHMTYIEKKSYIINKLSILT